MNFLLPKMVFFRGIEEPLCGLNPSCCAPHGRAWETAGTEAESCQERGVQSLERQDVSGCVRGQGRGVKNGPRTQKQRTMPPTFYTHGHNGRVGTDFSRRRLRDGLRSSWLQGRTSWSPEREGPRAELHEEVFGVLFEQSEKRIELSLSGHL